MKNVLIAIFLTASYAMTAEIDPRQLQQSAKMATTPAAHAKVASAYSDWAESLTLKAREHEQEGERLAKQAASTAMSHKWPALAYGSANRERRIAMQVHRAASEARAIAKFHTNKAEILADGVD